MQATALAIGPPVKPSCASGYLNLVVWTRPRGRTFERCSKHRRYTSREPPRLRVGEFGTDVGNALPHLVRWVFDVRADAKGAIAGRMQDCDSIVELRHRHAACSNGGFLIEGIHFVGPVDSNDRNVVNRFVGDYLTHLGIALHLNPPAFHGIPLVHALRVRNGYAGSTDVVSMGGIDVSYKSPFSGLKVVDLSQGIAGPYCAMLLAQYGADVIKVEPPEGDWSRYLGPNWGGHTPFSIAGNLGKRSVTLDLKEEADKARLWHLLDTADVFFEGFRPGVIERLGLPTKPYPSEIRAFFTCQFRDSANTAPLPKSRQWTPYYKLSPALWWPTQTVAACCRRCANHRGYVHGAVRFPRCFRGFIRAT